MGRIRIGPMTMNCPAVCLIGLPFDGHEVSILKARLFMVF